MTTYEYHKGLAIGYLDLATKVCAEIGQKKELFKTLLDSALSEAKLARELRGKGGQDEVPSDAGSRDGDSGSTGPS